MPEPATPLRLRDYDWQVVYQTSSVKENGQPVDILHDFYLPALARSSRYDRVAGYFRSTSLAAASQGFTAFLGRTGKMRLVVGADLDPLDVAVILKAGSTASAEGPLLQRLEGIETWPAAVRAGVELLARMIAAGNLEIKVAFRVHIHTGQPIPADSTEDGYVHEKWMLFFDDYEDAVYAAGSLNESRTALTLNAENLSVDCSWWQGKHQEKILKATADFNRVWENQSPALRVMTLPEAVNQRLLSIAEQAARPAEIDGSGTVSEPSAKERLTFAFIRDAPRMIGGQYAGLYTAPVESWPHQEVVARRLIDTWPYSFLLCDEVGLGKTIEAGLAIRSLYLSGTAKRILIAAPASLCRQWHRELASKFLLPFALVGALRQEYLHPSERIEISSKLFSPNLIIVSTGLLTRPERVQELRGADPFDITLLDEAHYARRRNSTEGTRAAPRYGKLYQTIADVARKRSAALWLATATPMQLDSVEVSDLVRLTERAGAFQSDPSLFDHFYQILGRLLRNNEPDPEQWAFLRNAILSLQRTDPLLHEYLHNAVLDALTRTPVNLWINHGRIPSGIHRKKILRFIFAAAPLSRVMLRHTRSLLEIYQKEGRLAANLPRRHLLPMPRIVFTQQEKAAYEELEVYCDTLRKQVEANRPQDRTAHTAIGFYLSFLRLRFASSLYAIRQTLERRRKRVIGTLSQVAQDTPDEPVDWEMLLNEDDDLEELSALDTSLKNRSRADLEWELGQLGRLLETLDDLKGFSSKMGELFTVINQRRDKVTRRVRQMVVFSRFYDTITDIVRRLRDQDAELRLGVYSGQGGQVSECGKMLGVDRETVKHRFITSEIDILLCTDAAAEGLNLQSADLLINFDLPWNPMKVEQRIGRIDRIGQKHQDIYVLNLCYADSAEQFVYDRLLSRLAATGSIVGTQQISMLPVTLEEFQQLADGSLNPDDLEARAHLRLAQRQEREATKQIPATELFDVYQKLSAKWCDEQQPVTLRDIEESLLGSAYLCSLGVTVTTISGDKILKLNGVPDVPGNSHLTVSRRIYETGLDGINGRIHFASYGDAVFEKLLEHVGSFELPACVRRIEECSGAMSLVGYVAAAKQAKGPSQPALFRNLRQIIDSEIDVNVALTDGDVQQARELLRSHLESEATRRRTVEVTVKRNYSAAAAQERLLLMLMADLIRNRSKAAGAADQGFRPFARELEEFILQRPNLIAHLRPLEIVHAIKDDILFEIQAPLLGNSGTISAPRFLWQCALDAAFRFSDRSRTGDKTVATIISRLEGEMARTLQ